MRIICLSEAETANHLPSAIPSTHPSHLDWTEREADQTSCAPGSSGSSRQNCQPPLRLLAARVFLTSHRSTEQRQAYQSRVAHCRWRWSPCRSLAFLLSLRWLIYSRHRLWHQPSTSAEIVNRSPPRYHSKHLSKVTLSLVSLHSLRLLSVAAEYLSMSFSAFSFEFILFQTN